MANKVNDGYSAPFFRVFYKGTEVIPSLKVAIKEITLCFDEEDNDEITIAVETTDRAEPDKKHWQEDEELTIVWGFIGENNSRTIKVWVRDPVWKFQSTTILGNIACTEKASDLKTTSSRTIYKKKSIAGIASDITKRHDIKGFIELPEQAVPEEKITPQFGETLSQYLIRERKEKARLGLERVNLATKNSKVPLDEFLKKAATIKLSPEQQKERELTEKYVKMHESGAVINVTQAVANEMEIWRKSQSLNIYKNIPQAGKSDLHLLKQLASREKDGPWVVETHGDELVIKKRNFLKAPYAAYEYGGEDGRLIEFSPESKKRARKGTSSSVGFSGWNPLDKTFFSGKANAADGSPSLTKAIEMLKFYKNISKRGGGSLVDGKRIGKTFLPFISNQNVQNKIDNSGVYTPRVQVVEITVDDKVKALEKSINDYNAKKEEKQKELYHALGINPVDAANFAGNSRRNSELKRNQVPAKIYGDPNITCGMIITILGVSKKYLGNYYITKATHQLSPGNEYCVNLELVRHGHNTKVNENYVESREIGRPSNSQTGKDSVKDKNATLVVKTNPTR